jgi:hypothetical protein
LYNKEPYYNTNKNNPAKDKDGKIAKADAPQRKDNKKAESNAPEKENTKKAKDTEEAEVNAAERDSSKEAKSKAGDKQAKPDLLKGIVSGDVSNNSNYNPSLFKTKKNRATKKKAKVASDRKGKGKACAIN